MRPCIVWAAGDPVGWRVWGVEGPCGRVGRGLCGECQDATVSKRGHLLALHRGIDGRGELSCCGVQTLDEIRSRA